MDLVACVLLPDHFHCIWSLPRGDDQFSIRWKRIKETFTREYLARGGTEGILSESRRKKLERGIWQRRFWEHLIQDETDFENCVNYIHWNPRKHGLVARVVDWRWSSFHTYVRRGIYEINWGGTDPSFAGVERQWGE
jgi:putative transposase